MTGFFVTNTDDSGPGSFRQAILDSNAFGPNEGIHFAIPGPGVHTIRPLSPLPVITSFVAIEGDSQPGTTNRPLIELDGSNAGPLADGLVFNTPERDSTVSGLVINRFGRHGVVGLNRSELRLEFNYIGTDALGQTDLGNGGSGVVLSGTSFVGDDLRATNNGNVISGNDFAGVWINGTGGFTVDIQNNFIGTDASGARALGNGQEGVLVEGGLVRITAGQRRPGNVISGNGASGIRLSAPAAAGATIMGNFIGTDVTGSRAIPNGASDTAVYRDGITSEGVNGLRIGGADAGLGNVISGNAGSGVSLRGGTGPVVQGNYIGTDATGNADVGNGGDGITLVTPAGPQSFQTQGNVISGNGGDGIHVESFGDLSGQLSVIGNNIGTNATGTGPLGNDGDGVEFHGSAQGVIGGPIFDRTTGGMPQALSPTTVGGNVISANGGSGVVLDATSQATNTLPLNVTVQGNRIGTDVSGNARMGNGEDGVRIVRVTGAGTAVTGNLLSANGGDGISVSYSTAVGGRGGPNGIGGNFIGTNADGNAALGNGGNGIALVSSRAIGIGGKPRGGNPVTQGPVNPAATGRNLISGNAGNGIFITGGIPFTDLNGGHYIADNFIGTDISGTIGVGNGGSGIYVASGAQLIGDSSLPNVISANARDGITLAGSPTTSGRASTVSGNRILFNRIGTDAAGSDTITNLGNGGSGIAIYNSANNSIGEDSRFTINSGNTIAFNAGSGISIQGAPGTTPTAAGPADGNFIARNSIFSNGGLGIDLVNGYQGVTPNDPLDADLGPNRLQNFPIITRASSISVSTTIRFVLNSTPSTTFRVDFYASPQADPSGFGEGKTFLGSANVTTDVNGLGSGVATFGTAAAPAPTPAGTLITATAAGPAIGGVGGSTSEFSAASPVVGPNTPATVEGRYTFYNQSVFDRSLQSATADDDFAIATDKAALLPGQTASFANITSYTRGINGVMIDVSGMPLDTRPNAGDFSVRKGTEAADGSITWSDGPAPAIYAVRRGAGVGGSDRLTLIWLAYNPAADPATPQAVHNGWLEVTVNAGARTGLASPDVFYFGNLTGETGAGDHAGTARAVVNALDLAAIKAHQASLTAGVTSPYDLNRDSSVNALDRAAAQANLSRSLPYMSVPVRLPPPAPGSGSADAEVASVWGLVST